MTGNEYQSRAMRTCSFDVLDPDEKMDMIHHSVFGLCAEAGEVASIFQKESQGHPFDLEHFKKELGDCLWMIAEAASAFDIPLDDVMQSNIHKLYERYPYGFEAERSIHRAEGDI